MSRSKRKFLIGSTGDSQPQVTSKEAGLFSVVWERSFGDTILTFGQLIDAEGQPLGSPFPVSDSTSRNRGLSFPSEGTLPVRQELAEDKQDEEGASRPAVAFQPSGTSPEEGTEVFFVAWVDRLDEADEPDPVLVSDR